MKNSYIPWGFKEAGRTALQFSSSLRLELANEEGAPSMEWPLP